jgi:hypothetical protein
MFTKRNLSAVALAVAIAAPVSAQGGAREARRQTDAAQAQTSGSARDARREAEAARERTDAVLTRQRIEDILSRGGTSTQTSRIPRGHLPPRGMCRVWIDGVPPGRQPAVTTCSQAEYDRARYGASARVIYGDSQSFPGRGNGKFKRAGTAGTQTSRSCVYRDAVVLSGGRVVDVCRDANGSIIGRDGRVVRRDIDDDDRFENSNRGRSKAQKHNGKGKGRG